MLGRAIWYRRRLNWSRRYRRRGVASLSARGLRHQNRAWSLKMRRSRRISRLEIETTRVADRGTCGRSSPQRRLRGPTVTV